MANNIKRRWEDITVDDFQKIFALEKADNEDKLLNLIAIVGGITLDDVMEMPLSKLERHFKDIEFLQEEPRIPLMKGRYTLNGRDYKVNAKELTTAQYIDFKNTAVGYYEHLPQFLSIFILPAGADNYADGYDMDQTIKDIGTMSIVDARSIAAFFLTEYSILIRIFLRYSIRRARRMARKAKTEKEKQRWMELERQMRNLKAKVHSIG